MRTHGQWRLNAGEIDQAQRQLRRLASEIAGRMIAGRIPEE
jgi:hypothetical protein